VREWVARFADYTDAAPYLAQENDVVPSRGRYRRDYVEMFAVTSGHGELVVYPATGRPRVHDIAPGRLVMLRPIDTVRFAATTGFRAHFVAFRNADWLTFAGLVRLDPGWAVDRDPPMATFPPGDVAALEPFESAAASTRGVPTTLDIVRFCLAVVPRLFPLDGPAPIVRPPVWLVRSIDAMREEPNLLEGLARWAAVAGVSPERLAAATGRSFGRTPAALLRGLRLRHAAELLIATTDSVQEVARRSGWRTIAPFSTAFRRGYGIAPREYRARAHATAL
jgi:AraC-like DNA-binding protein